ncbi:DNA polymerase III subunit beta [Candidatus Jorgensenbacteria bacterium GWC1_48_12]|uniref:Beta sliding clamp n=1 Tax=Candidatus Jorgensenbacteria bacterium GWC1_48_12 TaxID=1798469 RepID=A0A1F6BRD8_9BACT|nr:MAG: DNA polymerase III subunit beta [Candidatus Jorgensenbacteria bacterium GWC1_48_12]
MKLIILKTNLVEGLNAVEGSVGSDTNLPILKNVFLGTEGNNIIITSTNLELAIKRIVSGKIIEAGVATVPFQVLSSIIKNLNTERVTLEEKGNNLTIITDNYEASVLAQDPKDFPIIPGIQNKKNSIKTGVEPLKEALSNVIVAAQFSDIRPEISGVLVNLSGGKITLVATDSFRLAEVTINFNQTQSSLKEAAVIIPLKTGTEVLRILNAEKEGNAEIFIDQNQVLFEIGNNYVISRLVDGKFPDYQAIVPRETKNEISFNREEMMNAVKLAKVFAGRANDVSLVVGDNGKFLEVCSSDASLGENRYRLPVKLRGSKFKISFNWRYLMDGLKIYKGEEIVLGMNDPDRAVVLKNPNEPFLLYIAMPIKS